MLEDIEREFEGNLSSHTIYLTLFFRS